MPKRGFRSLPSVSILLFAKLSVSVKMDCYLIRWYTWELETHFREFISIFTAYALP